MTLYAKINSENIVENVIICEDSQIGLFTGYWVKITDSTKEAYIGREYNSVSNKFIPIKPQYNSWVLDENFNWVAPIEKPESGNYFWNEDLVQWEEYELDNTTPEE